MEDDVASRGVIRPAPAHIRTITTSGHITTVLNDVDGQARNETNIVPDTMSQLKVQQQRDFGREG